MFKKVLIAFVLLQIYEQGVILQKKEKPERKLMSLNSTELDNRAFEINEFRKQVGKFLSVLKDKQNTENQFKKIIGDHLHDLKVNMKKGKELIKEIHNNSMINLNSMMTILGFGLN